MLLNRLAWLIVFAFAALVALPMIQATEHTDKAMIIADCMACIAGLSLACAFRPVSKKERGQ